MSDLIDRQAAIDIERRATVDTNPEHFESHQKFVEFMDNAEISSFGRWQWSNGFNTALTAFGIDLKRLPTAQPERKKGKWITKTYFNKEDQKEVVCNITRCSNCDAALVGLNYARYCPFCGSYNEGD